RTASSVAGSSTAQRPRRRRRRSCDETCAAERLRLVDDVLYVEVARVDHLGVLGRLHPGAVAVVPSAQVGRERIRAYVRTLGLTAMFAHAAVGDEIDLPLGVRADDRADVAPFDDRVSDLGQLPLALAHD